eukprot:gene10242-272_t
MWQRPVWDPARPGTPLLRKLYLCHSNRSKFELSQLLSAKLQKLVAEAAEALVHAATGVYTAYASDLRDLDSQANALRMSIQILQVMLAAWSPPRLRLKH